jgi:hypothetical protein
MGIGERDNDSASHRDSYRAKHKMTVGKWSSRFTWAAIIQGSVVAIFTAMLAIITATTEFPQRLVEMMLASPAIGFAEISALAGLGLYLVVGVIGTGLTAQFYQHFEVRMAKPYRGSVSNGLAWTHLVLMNVGAAAASVMMIYSGYMGDVAVSPGDMGGLDITPKQAAEQILNPYIAPVSVMLLLMVAGAMAGGAGFLVNYFSKCGNSFNGAQHSIG